MASAWFTFITTLCATAFGIAIGNLSPLLARKISSRNDRRIALYRLTSPLTAILPLLQVIATEKAIEKELCLTQLRQYIDIAREPNIIEYLSDSEIKWALRVANLVELAYVHASRAEWDPIEGDSLYRLRVPDTTIERVMLPALWGTAQALCHLGERQYVDTNLSPQVAALLNQMRKTVVPMWVRPGGQA